MMKPTGPINAPNKRLGVPAYASERANGDAAAAVLFRQSPQCFPHRLLVDRLKYQHRICSAVRGVIAVGTIDGENLFKLDRLPICRSAGVDATHQHHQPFSFGTVCCPPTHDAHGRHGKNSRKSWADFRAEYESRIVPRLAPGHQPTDQGNAGCLRAAHTAR